MVFWILNKGYLCAIQNNMLKNVCFAPMWTAIIKSEPVPRDICGHQYHIQQQKANAKTLNTASVFLWAGNGSQVMEG